MILLLWFLGDVHFVIYTTVDKPDKNLASLSSWLYSIDMVHIHTLIINPPLINSSCLWASEHEQLEILYNTPHTGAVVSRTATLGGFQEDKTHAVALAADSRWSLNSYGYSPHPLSYYIESISRILASNVTPNENNHKPFIISITSSDPRELDTMLNTIQEFRASLGEAKHRIAVEFNASCPNIPYAPPPAYEPALLVPLIAMLSKHFEADPSLTLGLKLPPYVFKDQFIKMLAVLELPLIAGRCSIAFLSCTNTLGSSLFIGNPGSDFQLSSEIQPSPDYSGSNPSEGLTEPSFALPTPLGGLAGEALHSLALGNVFSFSQALKVSSNLGLKEIRIIGIGGVHDARGAKRMHAAGAEVVGLATALGTHGVDVFEKIRKDM